MKNTIKKLLAICLTLAMVCVLFAACGETAAESSAAASAESAVASTVVPPADDAEEASAAPEASAEEAVEIPEDDFFPLEETQEITLWNSFPSDLSTYASSQEDMAFTKNVEEALNVDLVMTNVSDIEVDTLFPLMLATGDYTDLIMFGKYTDSMETAVEEEIVLDFTEYVDEYCPHYKAIVDSDPIGYSAFTTDDGRYCAFYGVYTDGAPVQNGLATRSDWLKEAGFDAVPATIDGIEEYLFALKDNGHSNALWMDSNGAYFTNVLSAAFGVGTGWGGNPFILEDGEVVCSALQPGMKDYLQTLSNWYKNDLIDKDFATNFAVYMTDIGDVLNGKVGIWMDVGDRFATLEEQVTSNEPVDMMAIPYPTLKEGEENHYVLYREHSRGSLVQWVVSGTCENIELVLRFMDYGFTDDGYLLYNWGIEGDSYTVNEDGKKVFTEKVLEHPLGLTRGLELYAVSYLPCVYDYDIDEVKNAGCADDVKVWSDSAGDGANLFSLNNLSTEESEIVNGTGANDYNTYYKEQALRFMTGELNFDKDWDNFIANIETMNVQDICDAYQAAYDRVLEKTGMN